MFSDMPPTPSDPVRQLKIGGIPWTTRQAVLSLSAYAYQKAISLVLAIKAALHRWHLGRVLVHQFSLMARRIVPEPDGREHRSRDDTGRAVRWQRVRTVKAPELGLAAFKHEQQQERRTELARGFQAAEHAADDRKTPPREKGSAARGSGRGRATQARHLRK